MVNKLNARTATTINFLLLQSDLMGVIGCCDFLQAGLHAPDLTGILADGAVTGEFATTSNVVDDLLGPFLSVLFGNNA